MGSLPLALLLLADGRLPAGGHVHSGGVEQAIDAGRVTDIGSLASWLVERTRTVGEVEATLAAAAVAAAVSAAVAGPAVHGTAAVEGTAAVGVAAGIGKLSWDVLVAETEARTPVPELREASRARGRAFLRVAEAAFEVFDLPPAARDPGLPLPVATGAVVGRLGYLPMDAAVMILHGGAAEPAQAAVRRLGLDPVGITRLLAQLEPTIRVTAERAAVVASEPPHAWPATATPRFDLAAAAHADRDDRYFVT